MRLDNFKKDNDSKTHVVHENIYTKGKVRKKGKKRKIRERG